MLVDVHTHILPGIDDGAQDIQMAQSMLGMLAAEGVTDVVLTPHFYFQHQDMTSFLEMRKAAYGQLRHHPARNIRLHLGAEVEFSGLSVNYSLFRRLSIDGGKYIMLEFPYRGGLEKEILPKLERLIYQTGLIPIIAHVERYQGISDRPWLAADLIDMGCLLQVNGDSVLQNRSGSLVDALFRQGQVHLLGTDCHNITTRKPVYGPVMTLIEERYGTECRDYLTSIAEAVIRGDRIQVSAYGRIRKVFGRYR